MEIKVVILLFQTGILIDGRFGNAFSFGSRQPVSSQVSYHTLRTATPTQTSSSRSIFNNSQQRKIPSSYVSSCSYDSKLAARSICTFDETDFDGTVGDWPYEEKDMNRFDRSDDAAFYNAPRLVTHIDDDAISLLTEYYKQEFTSILSSSETTKNDLDILDLCSSWISHLPEDESIKYGRVVGVGMNEEELKANKQLTEYFVQDMNEQPKLSEFEDDSFDVICNAVSVDYLTQPLQIFQEMNRILRPGGIAMMSFSNRCFPTKAIAMWLQADELQRLAIVGSYFYYSAKWDAIEAIDLKEKQEAPPRPSPMEIMKDPSIGLAWMNSVSAINKANAGDPMFVVKGVK